MLAIDMQTKRPLGVTIIAVLMIIGGIVSIISGIIGIAGGIALPEISQKSDVAGISILLLGIGIFVVILGIATLLIAWGLRKAKPWAWTFTVIISIISIMLSVVGIATGGFHQVIS
jgi:lysylphosphatidylglycerol synthetase-like protein (DUF2156 family)